MAFRIRGRRIALGAAVLTLAAFVAGGADDRPAVQLAFDGTDGRVVFDAAVEGRNPGCRPVGATAVPVCSVRPAWMPSESAWTRPPLCRVELLRCGSGRATRARGAGAVQHPRPAGREPVAHPLPVAGRPHWVLTGDELLIGKAAARSVADGAWHHVAAVFSCPEGAAITPACFTLYIDGQPAPGGESARDGRAIKPVSPVVERAGVMLMYDAVFAASGYETTPRAAVDDFRIYSRAMSGIEVAALAAPGLVAVAGGPGGTATGCVRAAGGPGRGRLAHPAGGAEARARRPGADTAPAGEVPAVRILAPAQVAQTDLFQVRVLVPPKLRPTTDKYFFGGALVAAGEVEPDPFVWSLEPSPALEYPPSGSAPKWRRASAL